MYQMKRVLAALVFAAAAGVVGTPFATADEPKEKGKVKKPESAEPVKPVIIQLDASKLPPEVLKQLIQLSKSDEPSKPGKSAPTQSVKSISLTDAIAIAEKATKGTVVKAERKEEDGTVQFKLDVLDGKGGKSKVTLDASGKVTGTEKRGEEKDEDNKDGKKKKTDEDRGGSKSKKKEKDEDKDEGKSKKKEKDEDKDEGKGKKKEKDEDGGKGKSKKEKDD
jgi:uncharacterized membrane protein YkoI